MDEAAVAEIAAWAVLAVNLVAGSFAAWRWWSVQPSDAAWPLLRAGQGVAFVQAAVAGVLFATGYDPVDELYWLYALLPVVIGLIAEQLRIVAAEQVLERRGLNGSADVAQLDDAGQRGVVREIVRREIGIMATAALVIAFLALRVTVERGGL